MPKTRKKVTSRPDLRFALLLARTLGRTVQELGETMAAQEFGYWQAEYQREPWGDFRTDLAGGMVASVVANVNRDVKAKPVPYSAVDFMPFTRAPEPVDTESPTDFFNNLGAR